VRFTLHISENAMHFATINCFKQNEKKDYAVDYAAINTAMYPDVPSVN